MCLRIDQSSNESPLKGHEQVPSGEEDWQRLLRGCPCGLEQGQSGARGHQGDQDCQAERARAAGRPAGGAAAGPAGPPQHCHLHRVIHRCQRLHVHRHGVLRGRRPLRPHQQATWSTSARTNCALLLWANVSSRSVHS